jgi:predicted transcriptional regulator
MGSKRKGSVVVKGDLREQLSRRERQIMEIVYRHGRVSAAEVLEEITDPPSYSAVRSHLRILEEKGHLRHEEEGRRYVYHAVVPRDEARHGALRGLLENFFEGSKAKLISALLDEGESDLTTGERRVLKKMIRRAEEEGR